MSQTIYEQTTAAVAELCEKASLKPGQIVVVGCSTSEVAGGRIGKASVQERFDSKAFKEAEPELYGQYVKKSQVKGKFTVKLK